MKTIKMTEKKFLPIIFVGFGVSVLFLFLFSLLGEEKHLPESQLVQSVFQGKDDSVFPQLTSEVSEDELEAVIGTSLGVIRIKLFPTLAPKAVENFVTHSRQDYYKNTVFHRVIDDFMIQGGDPEGTGTGGESIWGAPFAVESSEKLFHIRGAVAMAKTSAPVSIGSQFFIVQNTHDMSNFVPSSVPEAIQGAYKNGGYPSLDGNYTVFGQVIDGMDIVDKIASTETDEQNRPLTSITVKYISVSH